MSENILGYDFEGPYTDPQDIHEKPGIYIVLAHYNPAIHPFSPPSSENKVLDVGESENVRDRIERHDRKDCWQNSSIAMGYAIPSFTFAVHYTETATESTRKEIEQQVRDHYNPPCGEM